MPSSPRDSAAHCRTTPSVLSRRPVRTPPGRGSFSALKTSMAQSCPKAPASGTAAISWSRTRGPSRISAYWASSASSDEPESSSRTRAAISASGSTEMI
ncbi:hypothetical protein [Streptomyces avidinii]